MRKSQFTSDQIHRVVRSVEASGKLLEVCRRYGISTNTVQGWWAKGTAGTARWSSPRQNA